MSFDLCSDLEEQNKQLELYHLILVVGGAKG